MATITTIRRICVIALSLSSLSVIAQQNTESKLIEQQSNGVKVYEQAGVISTNNHELSVEQTRKERTLGDWTLDECEEAIDQINQKITHVSETEENPVQITAYREELERIKKHMSTITSK